MDILSKPFALIRQFEVFVMDEIQINSSRAATRKEQAEQTAQAGVKGSISTVYDRKWKQFKAFCMNESVQEGNGVHFHFKITEEGCDPGEAIHIRSALESIYKR